MCLVSNQSGCDPDLSCTICEQHCGAIDPSMRWKIRQDLRWWNRCWWTACPKCSIPVRKCPRRSFLFRSGHSRNHLLTYPIQGGRKCLPIIRGKEGHVDLCDQVEGNVGGNEDQDWIARTTPQRQRLQQTTIGGLEALFGACSCPGPRVL